MRVNDDPPHRIISLVPGGPAAKSGAIAVGDHLLAIDDAELQGASAATMRSLIAGVCTNARAHSHKHLCMLARARACVRTYTYRS